MGKVKVWLGDETCDEDEKCHRFHHLTISFLESFGTTNTRMRNYITGFITNVRGRRLTYISERESGGFIGL